MAVKYKLIKKRNPQQADSSWKWYATPLTGSAQSVRTMSKQATANTTLSPMELETAINLFGEYAVQQLQAGNSIRVGDLGTLRITFKSDGVENIDDFKANAMIKNVRVIFTPSQAFRENVLQSLNFTNGGVLDEGINFASLSAYRIAKGYAAGNSEEETPEEEGSTDAGTGGGNTTGPKDDASSNPFA
ncbi:MAG: hypothetical protein LUB83_02440 [Prevotellaceae bacterium]|nr:hypothetical protein [Prevotellaceae bacterium]